VLSVEALHPLNRPVAAFPLGVFPPVLQRLIASIAEALPCPPDFPGTLMLPVLGTMIGRKCSIQLTQSWTEYPLIWLVVIARSGQRKSPAFAEVTSPLRKLQTTLHAQYRKEVATYSDLPAEKKGAKPRLKQIVTTDTTIEALKDVLNANPSGVAFAADELSGWVRSMCQYKGGRGDDRQSWLKIWSGSQIVCNRVGKDPVIIDDPFVSVVGGMQPDCLGDLIDDRCEDGLSARFLLSYPDPTTNNDWREVDIEGSQHYLDLCNALWSMTPSASPITLSEAAKECWIKWVNGHRKETPPDHLRPTWNKAEGHCLRLALILAVTSKVSNDLATGMASERAVTPPSTCDVESMEGAIKLIEYFKSHARRAYSSVPEGTGRIERALKWIGKHGGTVTARQVQMNRVCGVRNSEEAKELLSDLASLGHGVLKHANGSVVFTLSTPPAPVSTAATGQHSTPTAAC
jgi:hypothetical protein